MNFERGMGMGMKKVMSAVLAVATVGVLVLTGCGTNIPAPIFVPENGSETEKEVVSEGTQSVLKDEAMFGAYQAVLKNEAVFLDKSAEESLFLKQFNITIDPDLSLDFKEFAVIDLDGDDVPEIVLAEMLRNNKTDAIVDDTVGFLILRYLEDTVSGYPLYIRAFNDLKTDGTFSFSSGAADNGYGKINFAGFQIENYPDSIIDDIAYMEGNMNDEGRIIIDYFVNNEKSTEEEYDLVMAAQRKKGKAVWYDFNEENIETVLAGL